MNQKLSLQMKLYLESIIQNAIFYSKKCYNELNYNKSQVKIFIKDDGNGFSKDIIDKLGAIYQNKREWG